MARQGSLKTRPLRYASFPSFAAWEDNAPSLERWDRSIAELTELEASSDILHRVRAIVTGTAAALRNQQRVPREGSTAISLFGALCQAAEAETKSGISVEAQILACAHMMSLAVSNRRISEPWICKLQSLISGTPGIAGAGRYKRSPNRMIRQNGRARFGAPVSKTSQEMARYLRELRGRRFLGAHPVLQASYSHYSFVLIHPFADGNGRVARFLAGTFLYRSTSIPLFSLSQDRRKYLSALRAADAGDFRDFIDLVQESSIASSIQIQSNILAAMELSHQLSAKPGDAP